MDDHFVCLKKLDLPVNIRPRVVSLVGEFSSPSAYFYADLWSHRFNVSNGGTPVAIKPLPVQLSALL